MSVRWSLLVLALLAAAAAKPAGASTADASGAGTADVRVAPYDSVESDLGDAFRNVDTRTRRWTVHLDNDLFAFDDRDRDYTAGVAFSLTGESARRHPLSPSRLLDRVDALSGFAPSRRGAEPLDEALELGLLMFTPQDLSAEEPLTNDRPYANLLYVASTKLALDRERNTAFQSTFSIGFLGLPFAEQLHRAIHEVVGSAEPRGYDHQISDGGEPTFMYAVSRYRLLAGGYLRGRPYSVRLGVGGSVGYVTEANAEIAFQTDEPWWSSSAASSDYTGHPQILGPKSTNRDRPRLQFEAGLKVHARAYNAFLEGQFRHSDVTFDSSELEPLLVDLWLGATTVLPNGFSVSYTAHRQTEEIEERRGGRAFTWASISFAQRF